MTKKLTTHRSKLGRQNKKTKKKLSNGFLIVLLISLLYLNAKHPTPTARIHFIRTTRYVLYIVLQPWSYFLAKGGGGGGAENLDKFQLSVLHNIRIFNQVITKSLSYCIRGEALSKIRMVCIHNSSLPSPPPPPPLPLFLQHAQSIRAKLLDKNFFRKKQKNKKQKRRRDVSFCYCLCRPPPPPPGGEAPSSQLPPGMFTSSSWSLILYIRGQSLPEGRPGKTKSAATDQYLVRFSILWALAHYS